jgi:hypothetical protein
LGAIPGTLEAWLALRGLRTLHLRVERSTANATELVAAAGGPSRVERVRYPGFGGVIAIEVTGGAMGADLVSRRPGCGCTPPASVAWSRRSSDGDVGPASRPRSPTTLVRLSVGVEDVEDLWQDLSRASTSSAGDRDRARTRLPGRVALRRSCLAARETRLCSISWGVISPRSKRGDSLHDRHLDATSDGEVKDRLAGSDALGHLPGRPVISSTLNP